jgi:putative salt-induced outer membrane protein YdiY
MFRLAVFTLLAAGSAFADQVTLANGDKLSGRIQRLADGKLQLATEMAGAVSIPWGNVSFIVSTQPLYVVLKNGQVLSGAIVQSPKGLRVENSGQGTDISRDEVTVLRSYEQQLDFQVAEERRLAPHFLDPWQGFVDVGLSAARGNTDSTTISAGFNAARTRTRDKLTTYFNGLYSRNRTQLPVTVTSDTRRGGLRYELNFNPRAFGFVSGDFEADALQQLDLRVVGGAGFGRHVIQNKRNTFDLFGGATANREHYSTGLLRLTAEGLFSEESTHRINGTFSFRQKLGVFPNLTDTGDYRLTLDTTAVTTLLRWLSWQVTISDRYSTDPVPGTRKNDIFITTGFRVNLLPPK